MSDTLSVFLKDVSERLSSMQKVRLSPSVRRNNNGNQMIFMRPTWEYLVSDIFLIGKVYSTDLT